MCNPFTEPIYKSIFRAFRGVRGENGYSKNFFSSLPDTVKMMFTVLVPLSFFPPVPFSPDPPFFFPFTVPLKRLIHAGGSSVPRRSFYLLVNLGLGYAPLKSPIFFR